jgi:hypothetical protein
MKIKVNKSAMCGCQLNGLSILSITINTTKLKANKIRSKANPNADTTVAPN